MHVSAIFYFILPLYRVGWLISKWNNYEYKIVEQFIIYGVIVCFANVALSVYYMTENHSEELVYITNQRFKLFPIQPSKKRSVTKAGKCFIVIFALAFLGFPLLVLGIPFVIDYTPIQLIWNWTTNRFGMETIFKWILKGFSSVDYAITVAYAAGAVLSFLMI